MMVRRECLIVKVGDLHASLGCFGRADPSDPELLVAARNQDCAARKGMKATSSAMAMQVSAVLHLSLRDILVDLIRGFDESIFVWYILGNVLWQTESEQRDRDRKRKRSLQAERKAEVLDHELYELA